MGTRAKITLTVAALVVIALTVPAVADGLPSAPTVDLQLNQNVEVLALGGGKAKPGELLPAVMPTDQKAGLGSLNGLGSMNQLFVNSRGGDQTPALLLPAINAAREAGRSNSNGAQATGGSNGNLQITQFHHGSSTPSGGGGGAGKVQMQDLHLNAGVARADGGGGAAIKAPQQDVNASALPGSGTRVKTFLAPSRR